MDKHNLFNPSQHGFRCGRSCLSQLIAHYELILQLMEEGYDVDVIYLDFAKAFDKVDFDIILKKLRSLGIRHKLGRWIHTFITGRTQTVLVNGARSNPASVKSGVPQGSVLGPLLFLILIGDIDKDVASAFLSSFADDTRMGHGVNTYEDAELFQNDLKSVSGLLIITWNSMVISLNTFITAAGRSIPKYHPSTSQAPGLLLKRKHQ